MANDLTERLQRAAMAAIADQGADLEREPESIRGLTVELTVARDGRIRDCITYLERRKSNEEATLDHPKVRVAS